MADREFRFLAVAICSHELNCVRDATYAVQAMTTIHKVVDMLIAHGHLPKDANQGRQQVGAITRLVLKLEDISLWMRDYWDIVQLIDIHTPYDGQEGYRIISAHIGLGMIIGVSTVNATNLEWGGFWMDTLDASEQSRILGNEDKAVNVFTAMY